MRLPSVKTLQQLGITEQQAKQVRTILNEETDPCLALKACNEVEFMPTWGVETLRTEADTSYWFGGIQYLNTGETYQTTLLYDYVTRSYRVQSWGDCVETQERRGRKFLGCHIG